MEPEIIVRSDSLIWQTRLETRRRDTHVLIYCQPITGPTELSGVCLAWCVTVRIGGGNDKWHVGIAPYTQCENGFEEEKDVVALQHSCPYSSPASGNPAALHAAVHVSALTPAGTSSLFNRLRGPPLTASLSQSKTFVAMVDVEKG